MAARHLIRFALVSGALYAGWLAFNPRSAQAATAPDFLNGGSALDTLSALGDFSIAGDPFIFDGGVLDALPEPAPEPVTRSAGLFDFLGSFFDGASDGVSPNFRNVAPAGVNVDTETVARTIWGEARGGSASGMAAVANVIMNRVRDPRWPGSPGAVATQNRQFSTWNDGDPNGPKALAITRADPHFRIALDIAKDAVAGALRDQTGGATHFYAESINPPPWAFGGDVSARIGGHIFLTGVA